MSATPFAMSHPSLTTRSCKSGSHCQNAILEAWLFRLYPIGAFERIAAGEESLKIDRLHATAPWHPRCGGRARSRRLSRSAADARRRRAYGSFAGDGGRGRARRAVPFPRPGAVLAGAAGDTECRFAIRSTNSPSVSAMSSIPIVHDVIRRQQNARPFLNVHCYRAVNLSCGYELLA
jgi:hypothetical protein